MRASTTINAYIARLRSRSTPDFATVAATRTATATGATRINQPTITSERSFTPWKKVMTVRGPSPPMTAAAAPKAQTATINGSKSADAAAANGFVGTIATIDWVAVGPTTESRTVTSGADEELVSLAS